MNLEIVERNKVSADQWDDFVEKASEAWLWHRYNICSARQTWPTQQDIGFALYDRDDPNPIVALVPAFIIKEGFARIFTRHFLDIFGGVALRDDLQPKYKKKVSKFLIDALWQKAKENNCNEIQLSLSPLTPAYRGESFPKTNPLLEWGCENSLSSAWLIDLSKDETALWEAMEGRARTAIRKAEKSGVIIREANEENDLDIYYDMHVKTYTRTHVKPHPKEYFKYIWDTYQKDHVAQIFFAELEGEVVAAETFSAYKQGGEYWTGASVEKGLSSGANSLLQWTAIKWMRKNGFKWYNSGEAFPHIEKGKRKGLSDFKKSFGGELYPYYKGRLSKGLLSSLFYSYRKIKTTLTNES